MLVKDARPLEALAGVDQVALDKTGTVTRGTPHVVAVDSVATPVNRVVSLAASAEAPSEHVLARAIVAYAIREGIAPQPATDFEALPGRGVRATVDGQQVAVGDPVLLPDPSGHATALVEAQRVVGRTAIVVVCDGIPAGVLGLADEVRPDAADGIAALDSSPPTSRCC